MADEQRWADSKRLSRSVLGTIRRILVRFIADAALEESTKIRHRVVAVIQEGKTPGPASSRRVLHGHRAKIRAN